LKEGRGRHPLLLIDLTFQIPVRGKPLKLFRLLPGMPHYRGDTYAYGERKMALVLRLTAPKSLKHLYAKGSAPEKN